MGEVRQRMGGLPTPSEAEGVWRDIWYQEAHNSTALEGNTLVLKQVERLLAEGVVVGQKDLTEYLEVKGYAQAAEWVYSQGLAPRQASPTALLTVTEVRQVHATAMALVWAVSPHPHATSDEGPGGFRRHDVERFPGGMRPPDWTQVQSLLGDWVDRVRGLAQGLPFDPDNLPGLPGIEPPVLEQVGAAHAAFERIHPFIDGNGRAGRLVLNLMLVRLGYPPAIIYKRQRREYLDALRRADAGDAGPLGELVARAVQDNLHRFVIPAVAGPNRLVPLAALQTRTLSHTALRVAALRGRLRAQQGPDGTWRSTRLWVDEYLSSRYKRQ